MTRSQNWFEHALRRTGWQPERQVVALATLGVFIALILGALYLSQVANEATTNRRLSQLLVQRDDLERVNEQLRAEVAALRAVPRLLARAEALGFTIATQDRIEWLLVPGYYPAQGITAAPVATAPPAGDDYDESFIDWLRQRLDGLGRLFGRGG